MSGLRSAFCICLQWQPTPVFLPGESHGQRSLVGYSSWGHKESDMTERLHPLSLLTIASYAVIIDEGTLAQEV